MKNLRFTAFLITMAVFVFVIFGIESHYLRLENMPFSMKLLLFVLFNLNLVALLTLMFFVGKSLFRVYLERKNRVLGYKFKTKFVVILVVLTLIPSVFLFIVSSGIVTNYLDRLFDPRIKHPLDQSIEMAKSVYEIQRKQTLLYAKAMSSGRAVPENYSVVYLAKMPENASETIRSGFEGKEGSEVITGENGDTIRAVVPEYHAGRQRGIIVVESFIGREISSYADQIKEVYANYLTLETWKAPIKTNYLLILSFVTLLIVFTALWVALRLSRNITEPIQRLAQSTGDIAKGDFNINPIDIKRDDEIGLLVNSFNNMVRDLKENKESLHRAWTESDRRRLIIENILENINSGVIYLDISGSILTINRAACNILNISPEEIINKNYSVLMSVLKSEELREVVRNIRVREFKGFEKEMRVKIKDRVAILRVFITTLKDSQSFLGTLVVFDDLTEIVKAQKSLAWQEVARRIAHEIKNPLTPIKLSTEHMISKWHKSDADFGQAFERSTKTIIKEVESLKRLVDEFSRFGKMPEINKKPAVISTIIEEVVNLYRDYHAVRIEVLKPEQEPRAELDAEQFKRVIINMVDNAMQAMQNKGRIDIEINYETEANRVFIDVKDTGVGIPEEDREKLFLPYFSTKKDGTGLGLAIANRVIAEHKGNIRVTDNKPHGAVFTIVMPIKEE